MSKMKKVLLMAVAYVLVAALAVGGTLAYLQAEDGDVNVMTLGNVKIEQHEYERVVNADGSYATKTIDNVTSYVLKDFTQAKPLLPIVGDPNEPGDSPAYAGFDSTIVRMTQVDSYGGMQVFAGKNAQDKFVTVENTGKSDAYVRTLVAIECGTGNPALIRIGDRCVAADQAAGSTMPWIEYQIGKIVVDNNTYFLLEYVYRGASDVKRHENGILPAGDTTYPSLCQVYLKHNATNEDMVALDGNGNGTLDILVLSQAVQVAGFADAETALNAGFGDITTTNHPWADGVKVPVVVSSADDMYAALDAGEKDLVVVGATIDENNFNGRYYKDRNVDFVDCTFTAHMNYMYINDATFTNCTFDCGAANAAVHYDELFGDLVFNNCTFKSGKIQIGANNDMTGTVTFNDCVFENTTSTSIWSDNGIRVYSPATFNGCEFNNRVVLAGSNGLSVTFDSCTMNGGTPVYYVDNTDGIIRGGNIPVVTIK